MQRKPPDKLLMGQANVKKLFEVTKNLKHNTMLKLCYGMGLRVSEIVNVKIKDVDSKNMQVFIAKAKGKKDRYANLPEPVAANKKISIFILIKTTFYELER